MRIIEHIQLAPPPPPRTFDLMEVTEADLKLLRFVISKHTPPSDPLWDIYLKLNTAIAD